MKKDHDKTALRNAEVGRLLRGWREGMMTRAELGEVLGVSGDTIKCYERGTLSLPPTKIEDVIRAFNLSKTKARKLWDARLPALNPALLAKEPKELQGVLLLKACRELKGLSQGQLAHRLGYSDSHIAHIEQGDRIPQYFDIQLECLIAALELEPSQAERLRAAFSTVPSLQKKRLKLRHSKNIARQKAFRSKMLPMLSV